MTKCLTISALYVLMVDLIDTSTALARNINTVRTFNFIKLVNFDLFSAAHMDSKAVFCL